MGTQAPPASRRCSWAAIPADVVRRSTKPFWQCPKRRNTSSPSASWWPMTVGVWTALPCRLLLDIARKGNAEIHLVRVKTDEERTGSHYPELLDGISFRTFEIEGEDVESALNDQVKVSDADLVVMLRRKLGLFEGIFHRSASSAW